MALLSMAQSTVLPQASLRITDCVVKRHNGCSTYDDAFAMLIGVAAILTWPTDNGLFRWAF